MTQPGNLHGDEKPTCYGQTHVVRGAYRQLGLLFCQCGDSYHWISVASANGAASIGLRAA